MGKTYDLWEYEGKSLVYDIAINDVLEYTTSDILTNDYFQFFLNNDTELPQGAPYFSFEISDDKIIITCIKALNNEEDAILIRRRNDDETFGRFYIYQKKCIIEHKYYCGPTDQGLEYKTSVSKTIKEITHNVEYGQDIDDEFNYLPNLYELDTIRNKNNLPVNPPIKITEDDKIITYTAYHSKIYNININFLLDGIGDEPLKDEESYRVSYIDDFILKDLPSLTIDGYSIISIKDSGGKNIDKSIDIFANYTPNELNSSYININITYDVSFPVTLTVKQESRDGLKQTETKKTFINNSELTEADIKKAFGDFTQTPWANYLYDTGTKLTYPIFMDKDQSITYYYYPKNKSEYTLNLNDSIILYFDSKYKNQKPTIVPGDFLSYSKDKDNPSKLIITASDGTSGTATLQFANETIKFTVLDELTLKIYRYYDNGVEFETAYDKNVHRGDTVDVDKYIETYLEDAAEHIDTSKIPTEVKLVPATDFQLNDSQQDLKIYYPRCQYTITIQHYCDNVHKKTTTAKVTALEPFSYSTGVSQELIKEGYSLSGNGSNSSMIESVAKNAIISLYYTKNTGPESGDDDPVTPPEVDPEEPTKPAVISGWLYNKNGTKFIPKTTYNNLVTNYAENEQFIRFGTIENMPTQLPVGVIYFVYE